MISFTFRNASCLRLQSSAFKPPLISLRSVSRGSRWTAHQSANSLSPDPHGCRAARALSSARALPRNQQELVEKLLKMDRRSLNTVDMTPLTRSARAMIHIERCRRKVEDLPKSSLSPSLNSGKVNSLKHTVSETVGKLLSTRLDASLESGSPSKRDKIGTGVKNTSNSRTSQPSKVKRNSDKGKVADGYHLHSELSSRLNLWIQA